MIELPILILQFGIAITFLLTGILILLSKDRWVHMLPAWFSRFPWSPRSFMTGTALGDVAIGVWLISGYATGIAAIVASAHLAGVLLVSGKHEFHEVYRDIGLLMASISLSLFFLA
ncbi:MAG: hypothetical protein AAB582_03250 [Patescibacteria group bacterium]|jgi:hypothetical protein